MNNNTSKIKTFKFYLKEESTEYQISAPQNVYEEFKDLANADQESFWILGTNTNNRIVIKELVFLGGLNTCTIDPKIIFRRLLLNGCHGFILIHNHPSGNLEPSKSDIDATEALKKGSEILNFKLLDHLIISSDGFFSFSSKGLL